MGWEDFCICLDILAMCVGLGVCVCAIICEGQLRCHSLLVDMESLTGLRLASC